MFLKGIMSKYVGKFYCLNWIHSFRTKNKLGSHKNVKEIRNKRDVYRGENFMKKFCECLKKHAGRMINFEKKKMKLLTNERQKSYENAKICYICREKFEDK